MFWGSRTTETFLVQHSAFVLSVQALQEAKRDFAVKIWHRADGSAGLLPPSLLRQTKCPYPLKITGELGFLQAFQLVLPQEKLILREVYTRENWCFNWNYGVVLHQPPEMHWPCRKNGYKYQTDNKELCWETPKSWCSHHEPTQTWCLCSRDQISKRQNFRVKPSRGSLWSCWLSTSRAPKIQTIFIEALKCKFTKISVHRQRKKSF